MIRLEISCDCLRDLSGVQVRPGRSGLFFFELPSRPLGPGFRRRSALFHLSTSGQSPSQRAKASPAVFTPGPGATEVFPLHDRSRNNNSNIDALDSVSLLRDGSVCLLLLFLSVHHSFIPNCSSGSSRQPSPRRQRAPGSPVRGRASRAKPVLAVEEVALQKGREGRSGARCVHHR